MTAEDWKKVKEVLNAALEAEPQARSAFLDSACEGDAALREEVESLLASYDDAGSFIEDPAEMLGPAAAGAEALRAGEDLGPYRIVQPIAEGGMGAVYQAVRVDDLYRKVVAVKVIKRGISSEYVLRRFDTERQILAHLDHPNIAKLLDGGTTADGRPYFVMDFIAGTPVDDYCDERRLSVRDRIAFFLTVCNAVHYAHQNLVVHRDLKPQNILVTAEGAVKLLDFGIAKLLDPDGVFENTATMLQALTPEYASPEQLAGKVVTTSSDVYSLGVLLYRLLTGHRPYALSTRSLEEIWDNVRNREPRKPSTVIRCEETGSSSDGETVTLTPELVSGARGSRPERLERELSGDLDNIVMMALRKEPERRYSSVEQFANDLKRYLSGHPVTARQDTLRYRTYKFVKRHRGGVLAAAAFTVTLVAGILATAWQAHVANRERLRAERRFEDVRGLAHSVLFELHDSIARLPGSTQARQLLVERARTYIDALAKESEDDASLQRERAAAYERIGDVLGMPTAPNLGQTAAALESYRKALLILGSVAGKADDASLRRDMARVYNRICALEQSAGEYQRALNTSLQAARILQETPGQNTDAEQRSALAATYQNVANAYFALGDWAHSEEYRDKALREFADLHREHPGDDAYLSQLAMAHQRMAGLLEQTKRYAEGRRSALRAIGFYEQLVSKRPIDLRARLELTFAQQRLGSILISLGDLPGSLRWFQTALPIREQLWQFDRKDVRAQINLANSYASTGWVLLAMGETLAARKHFERQRELAEELVQLDPVRVDHRTSLSEALYNLGRVANRLGQKQRARAYLKSALALYEDLHARGAVSAEYADAPARIRKELESVR